MLCLSMLTAAFTVVEEASHPQERPFKSFACNTAFGSVPRDDFRAQETASDKPNPMLEATQVFFRPSLGFPPLLAILFFALPMFG